MNIVRIPESWGIKRTPASPIEDKLWLGLPYVSFYDFYTLFADCIDIGDNRTILIGPPLFDIENLLTYYSEGKQLKHTYVRMDRMLITLLEGNSNSVVQIKSKFGNLEIPVTYPSTEMEGLNVIVTTQCNDPLHWIKDWITYYYKNHNVRGFVFYNNNSDKYTTDEMLSYLSGTFDDIVIKIEESDMPYGCPSTRWDSNFCQHINFEHFKYKYAWCANVAINHDIDELLVIPNGNTLDNIVNELKHKKLPGLVYEALFIDPYNFQEEKSASELGRENVRHKDYYHWWKGQPDNAKSSFTGPKWIAVPEYAMQSQWTTHFVQGAPSIPLKQGAIFCAHYLALKSVFKDNCKDIRPKTKDTSFAPVDELIFEPRLKSHLDVAFSD